MRLRVIYFAFLIVSQPERGTYIIFVPRACSRRLGLASVMKTKKKPAASKKSTSSNIPRQKTKRKHAAVAPRPSRHPISKLFRTFDAFHSWLERHHDKKDELWVRMHKKSSGKKSTDWQTSVRAALCWGWIDSTVRSVDESCYIQRFTPRRPKSVWSKKNRKNVKDMIVAGKMREPGMAHVRSARKDGRWAAAY